MAMEVLYANAFGSDEEPRVASKEICHENHV
jgi:hypothetical protein